MAVGDPTGADLVSGTTDGDTIATQISWEEREISLGAGVALTNGTKYAIVVRAPSAIANIIFWDARTDNPYANGVKYESSDSGGSWAEITGADCYFQTKASAVVKDDGSFVNDFPIGGADEDFYDVYWTAQTFIASSAYTITSVILRFSRLFGFSPGTITVSIRATVDPGKATTPTPTDDQEGLLIAGKDQLKLLQWEAPSGETPDYLVYFRAEGESWELQETITDDSTEHTLSDAVLDALVYYSIYEWRVDTREGGVTTTGDIWTFISQYSSTFTDFNRRSDYDADQVWQPGVGWVDINSFEFTGGGRYKGRVLVVGHKVIFFGDL